ncbi:hypothetical protein ASG87_14420 [Frateuria sp. Soil773]|uniref:hypothetical protein n=1 Tax=Frateuria sp. Soil773 TaxID=1736407 RepID=UPI0006FEFC57|nr:hypothetical protein [Frateuria sp. Soil773]KRE98587.1 hypothetical protein ASG87_14420 [Frateuria sp. Soil773]
MMLTFLRSLARRPKATETADADATLCKIDLAEAMPPHVDYDRQPLNVRELDHYIDRAAEDDRFHVH